jgi:hypothetical protein
MKVIKNYKFIKEPQMVIRIIALLTLIIGSFMVWRALVGQSRLVVQRDDVHFPTVSGYNLDRQEREFPRDFDGELNLIFVAFQRWHQSTVNTWIPYAQELEGAFPDVVYYELPTIDELPTLSRTFINEGMRAGIPDQTARERTVTLYLDMEKFMTATGIPGTEEVHVLLVDREGEILWRTTGEYEETTGAELLGAIRSARSEDADE